MKNQFAILFFSSLLLACGNDNHIEQAAEISETVVSGVTSERAKRAQEVFQTIPSPMETASLFHNAETPFNVEISNPQGNQSNYVTNGQKALNLGVYGADLSYANVFDQSEQSMIYINCSKKLADALDVSAAFDVATIERIEENINNRDSLMVIINDAFWIIDRHLNSNGQDHLSALIMLGGWVEGLYLGTKVLDKENPDAALMQRIADQKSSLMSLMDLLITYDNTDVVAIERKMKPLQTAYAKIDARLPDGQGKAIDQEVIFEIGAAVAQLRAGIIQ